MSVDLVRYDAMVFAIAECHRIDEVQEIKNKAMALEAYARQARNVDAERKANEIRLRAERRAGDLMEAMQREPGKRSATSGNDGRRSEYRQALEDAQIPERTARRYQALARVPEHEFEAALRDPVKPTTTSLIKAMNGATKMDDNSLWLWGRLRDFERQKLAERSFSDVFGGMTETMQSDVRRIAPVLIEWLSQIEEVA